VTIYKEASDSTQQSLRCGNFPAKSSNSHRAPLHLLRHDHPPNLLLLLLYLQVPITLFPRPLHFTLSPPFQTHSSRISNPNPKSLTTQFDSSSTPSPSQLLHRPVPPVQARGGAPGLSGIGGSIRRLGMDRAEEPGRQVPYRFRVGVDPGSRDREDGWGDWEAGSGEGCECGFELQEGFAWGGEGG
jgi:hypothetical protein